jgi:hypothetical protein
MTSIYSSSPSYPAAAYALSSQSGLSVRAEQQNVSAAAPSPSNGYESSSQSIARYFSEANSDNSWQQYSSDPRNLRAVQAYRATQSQLPSTQSPANLIAGIDLYV